MTKGSRRFMVQGSGVMFAAVVAAALPSPRATTAIASTATAQAGASATTTYNHRQAATPHFVGFAADDSITADIRHRWP